MQPQLAATYNSQSNVSTMGIGWSLAGSGSAISRINKTVATNGAASAPTLGTSDAIALDGQRLVLISGVYGASGSAYATENESYSRITLSNSLGAANASFKVVTKQGSTIEYGTANNAAFKSSATGAVILWRINKVTDAYGNYMNYTYEDGTTSRSSYLTEINYTGNDFTSVTITPYNKVKFIYAVRSIDANTVYIAGSSIKSDKKLTNIEVYEGTTKFRQYDFAYGAIPHQLLTSINFLFGTFNKNAYLCDIQLE